MRRSTTAHSTALQGTAALFVIALVFVGATCSGDTAVGGVLRTPDSAETWEIKNYSGVDRNRVVTIDGLNITKVRIDPKNPAIIYLTTIENGIYKSDTGGDQWYVTPLGSGTVRDLQIDPVETNILYATLNNQVIRSTDSGMTWESIYTDAQGGIITRLAIDWFSPSRIYAGTSLGTIIITEDSGSNWRVAYDVVGQISDLLMSGQDSRILYATELGKSVHRTRDAGASWADLFAAQEKLENPDFQKFLSEHPEVQNIVTTSLDTNDGNRIYIGTKYGLLTSSNGGDSWTDITTLIAKKADQNLLMKNITTVKGQSSILFFTINNQIHKSVDGGATWKTIDNVPSAKRINYIAEHPLEPGVFYAGMLTPEEQKKSILQPF